MKTKKNTPIQKILSILLVIVLVLAISLPTLAWFYDKIVLTPASDFSARSVMAYFAGGDGLTKATAYEIENSAHVYNLAWLQYLGVFNQDADEDGNVDQQYYFVLNNDIDMEGLVIPPIGTEENPFIGNFDGGGHCIYDFTVSNYMSSASNDGGIVEAPSSVKVFDNTITVNETKETASIVGFFGVIGDWNNSLNGLNNDSEIEEISNKTNAVYNLYLNDMTVRTETSQSLMGLLAGYVGGSIQNVGIGSSQFVVGDNVDALKLSGLDMLQLISRYSLVGEYDSSTVIWSDNPSAGSSAPGGSSPGDGSSWGGTIDMLELNKRLSYIIGSETKTLSQSWSIPFNRLGFVGTLSKTSIPYKNKENVIYFSLGTVLPLNINKDIMFAGDEIDTTLTYSKYTYDHVTKKAYQEATSAEEISNTNTGYLVGGNYKSSGDVRLRAYSIASGSNNYGIFRSLGFQSENTGATFNGANFKMLTIDPDGNTYAINDRYNGTYEIYLGGITNPPSVQYDSPENLKFTQYYKDTDKNNLTEDNDLGVRSNLTRTLQGQSIFHSIHFMDSLNIDSINSEINGTIVNEKKPCFSIIPNASINGKELANYQVVNSAFNFTVSKPGVITTVAATNYNSLKSYSLFYLYKIERDTSTNAITSVTEIQNIYKNKDIQGNEKPYAYNLVAPDPDKYEKVYDSSTMNNLTVPGAAYYFEIPVNDGDYAIGCSKDDTAGAYLMYLDIGANGNADSGGGGETPAPSYSHEIQGINFVDYPMTQSDISKYPVLYMELKADNPTHPKASLAFKRTSVDTMTYQLAYHSDGTGLSVSSTAATGVTVSPVTNLLSLDSLKLLYNPNSKRKEDFYKTVNVF